MEMQSCTSRLSTFSASASHEDMYVETWKLKSTGTLPRFWQSIVAGGEFKGRASARMLHTRFGRSASLVQWWLRGGEVTILSGAQRVKQHLGRVPIQRWWVASSSIGSESSAEDWPFWSLSSKDARPLVIPQAGRQSIRRAVTTPHSTCTQPCTFLHLPR